MGATLQLFGMIVWEHRFAGDAGMPAFEMANAPGRELFRVSHCMSHADDKFTIAACHRGIRSAQRHAQLHK